MKLKQLCKGLSEIVIKGADVPLSGISNDSRTIAPGNLFIARQGTQQNGADFIAQATSSGAAAVLTDLYDPFVKITQIIAKCPGDLEAFLASRFYQDPSQELYVVGVTGTKGKTTTVTLIHHLLKELGTSCGLMSTVETIVGEERKTSTHTTHSSIYNQKILREMVLRGCQAAVLEVSSHGLVQGRVNEIAFDSAIFTNLTPDHFDYHANIEDYAAAKRTLFSRLDDSPKKNKRALFNADSEWTAKMRSSAPCWTFGLHEGADLSASHLRMEQGETRMTVAFEGQREEFRLPIMGLFNVYNALGAIGIGLHRGAKLSDIAAALQTFRGAPGRLEQVPNDRGILVFVDYAHMGDALGSVLQTLRELAPKRLICVFGCGGDRDSMRRVKMAEAAEQGADLSIITSDNPRSEDPMSICQAIRAAFLNPALPIVEVDRAAAIHLAISQAKPGDIVLIAGKGHEKVQIFHHHTTAFDDVAVAKEALQK